PDEDWGESVAAVVQPENGVAPGSELAASILASLDGRLARMKWPRRIEFIADMPRDPSGKLLKRRLRDPYWQGRGAAICPARPPPGTAPACGPPPPAGRRPRPPACRAGTRPRACRVARHRSARAPDGGRRAAVRCGPRGAGRRAAPGRAAARRLARPRPAPGRPARRRW